MYYLLTDNSEIILLHSEYFKFLLLQQKEKFAL